MMVSEVVGNSADVRTQIDDENGAVREGVVVVKFVGKNGPYGYRVTYVRHSHNEHSWEYLGSAEPGLGTGTYAPRAPLKFFQGRQRDIRDKKPVFVGDWDSLLTTAELDDRLDNAGYLEEIAE